MEDKQKVVDLLESLSRMNVSGFYIDFLFKKVSVPKKLVMETLEEWVVENKISIRYILSSPDYNSSFQKVYDKIEDIPVGEWFDESPFDDEFEVEMDLVNTQYYFTPEQRIETVKKNKDLKGNSSRIKQVLNLSVQEFTYDSEETREEHVAAMEKSGWTAGAKVKRLKSNVSIFNATEDDYEWFAAFNHVQPLDLNTDRMLTHKDSNPENKDAKEEGQCNNE